MIPFLEVCRIVGLAGRFVSGYYGGEPELAVRHLHARPEVYLPGIGWRGYDPMYGLAVADQHIAVAAASTSSLAAPTSGGDLSWLSWLARKGEAKLKSKDMRLIQEAQELGGLR